MSDVSEPELEPIRMTMLLSVAGHRYGDVVMLPDSDKTWGWFASGVCTFADEDDWSDPMEPWEPADDPAPESE